MKVLLVQLPHFFGEGKSRPPENYPLGLGYVSAYLGQHGLDHDGIDLWGRNLGAEEALEQIDFGSYDVVGVSSYATQYRYLRQITRGIKERWPSVRIVCGGAGPTFSAATILENTGVDICVIGEGELTMLDLLERIDTPEKVAGIALMGDGGVEFTPARPYLSVLDSLPLPNRDLFDFESYVSTANAVRSSTDMPELKRHPRRAANIIAGRGCPYHCRFCSKTFSGCRLRGVDAIIEEIEMLRDRWKVDFLMFDDELVVTSKKRILDICGRLGGMGMKWTCAGRINQVDREILEAMKAAGCESISYGVESISQSILDAMDKRLNADDILPVLQMTREAGIKPVVLYMFGYPGENDGTLAATERFFRTIDERHLGYTLTPIPGSPLYEDLMRDGRIGDEHDYLMRLDSGYNIQGPQMNLTDWTDEEFLAKKRRLAFRIDNAYLSRRPAQYAKVIARVLRRRVKAALHRS